MALIAAFELLKMDDPAETKTSRAARPSLENRQQRIQKDINVQMRETDRG
jgi:hypothetical protein